MTKKKTPPQIRAKRKETSELCKCDLSDAELLAYGQRMADQQQERRALEDQLTSMKKEFQCKIDACDAEIARLAAVVRCKYEHRQVKCELLYDYTNMVVVLTRLDTNKIERQRVMTADETQIPLDAEMLVLTPGGKVKAEPAGKLKPPPPGLVVKDEPPKNQPTKPTPEQLESAVDIIAATKRASMAMLQRRMKVSYQVACDIMAELESAGVVGPAKGSEPRDILDLDALKKKTS